MTDKQRRGLGRGLGSLIPTAPVSEDGDAGSGGGGTTTLLSSSGGTSEAPPRQAAPPTDWIGRIDGPSAADGATAAPDVEDSGSDAGPGPVQGAHFAEIAVGDIRPNPRQPREVFDEEALAELVDSITEVGLLQPVVVRPAIGGGYELIMGERRWRATQRAGLATIPAIVRDTTDDDLLRDALLENLHRAQLNPLEEAAAYQQLLDDFGCTQEELSRRIGRSRPQISNTLRLLKLSPSVQRRVAAGVLSAGHARALVSVVEATTQDRLAERVVAEGISVRALEELVAVGDHDEEAVPRVRRAKPVAPRAQELAEHLSDLYETRVRVDLGQRKGRITIEFASLQDLERIVAAMDAPSITSSS